MKFLKFGSKIIIILFILCCSFFQTSLAIDSKNISTVTIANVNDNEFFDVEIIQNKNGEILIPIKQIADILELKLKINHETKDIFFNDYKISKNFVFKNNQKLSDKQNIYLKKGFMDEVKDEIFCSDEIVSQIFDTNISVNQNDLSIMIISDKNFSRKQANIESSENEKPYKIYTQIEKPMIKKKFSLDTINFSNSMFSDSATQIYQTSRSNSSSFNNSGILKLEGQAFGGSWQSNFMGNSYKKRLFSFSGLNIKYDKFYKNKMYEIGSISGLQNDNNSSSTGLLGVQIYDHNPKNEPIQNLDGEVEKDSLVNVYINDKLDKTLSTYNGYYTLSDYYYYNNDIKKLELKELSSDGKEKTILTKIFHKNKDKGFDLDEHEKRNIFFTGISGFDDRLFAQDGYFYQTNSKKLTLGFQQKYAIKENLISTSSLTYDKIVAKSQNSIWGENFYNTHSILSMGTYKNPNNLEGITVSNSIDWLKSENLKLQSNIKASYAKNISNNESLFGYSAEARSIFEKENLRFTLGLYNISPDFYQSGSRFGFISDRLGGKIGLSYQYKNWSTNGTYNKYFSNTLNKIDGGLIDFDEINFNIRGNLKNIAQIRYQINSRNGQNNLGEISNIFQDLNISKTFRNGFLIEGGEQKSSFSSEILDFGNSQNSFISDYSTIYLKTAYQFKNNKGRLELGHDITEYSSLNHSNSYNMIKVGYNFPEFKRFLLYLNLGYKYSGLNRGFNYSASLGYKTKTGMVVSLMYRYDTDMGYMFDNMYMPTSQRHSINLTFNDTIAVTPSGLKSIGQENLTGLVEVRTFLDKNNNGKFDKDDIGVENIPIKMSKLGGTFYTNKRGKTLITTQDQGVHQVYVKEEELPCNLSISKGSQNKKLVIVKPSQQTQLDFIMTSSVGNIKGNLKVIDDFGRVKSIQDFIVVLHDKNDIEIAYSTVDELGNYYFSGISPGEYTIKLDENFQKKYNLIAYEDKGILNVEIPFIYKESIEINNKNLIYKSW